jgi:hypothetical protein
MILPRKPTLSISAPFCWTQRARLLNLCSVAAALSGEVAAHIAILGCTVRTACHRAKYGLGVKFYVLTIKKWCVSFVLELRKVGEEEDWKSLHT